MSSKLYCPTCHKLSEHESFEEISEGEWGPVICSKCGSEFVMLVLLVPKPYDYHWFYRPLEKCKDESWKEKIRKGAGL